MIIDYPKFAQASVLLTAAEYMKLRVAANDSSETTEDFETAVQDVYDAMVDLEESLEVMERWLFDELESRFQKLIID